MDLNKNPDQRNCGRLGKEVQLEELCGSEKENGQATAMRCGRKRKQQQGWAVTGEGSKWAEVATSEKWLT